MLPDYMVPSAFVELAALPLTDHGKLDRRALPAPQAVETRTGRGPRDLVEATVCEIFAEVLDLPEVGIDDDFFGLGGHSMLLVRLRDRLQHATGRQVAVADLFRHPTAAALAGLLRSAEGSGTGLDVLFTVRSEGGRTPLWCPAPATGLGWRYAALRAHVPQGVPIHALQAPNLAGGPAVESLEELVEAQLAELTRVQPHGPYRLLGWSLGGVVAQALACRLQERGEEVELLALLDSYAGDAGEDEPAPASVDAAVEGLGLAEPTVAALHANYTASTALLSAFSPARYRGTLLHFRASDAPRRAEDWAAYTDGEVVVHTVADDHDGLLDPSALRKIAAVLSEHTEAWKR
jgi:thioesterase domain-containing protein/aryl carrier-like protein